MKREGIGVKSGKNSANNANTSNTIGGGSQSTHNESNSNSTNQLVKTPPQAGESHTKVIKGKTRK